MLYKYYIYFTNIIEFLTDQKNFKKQFRHHGDEPQGPE